MINNKGLQVQSLLGEDVVSTLLWATEAARCVCLEQLDSGLFDKPFIDRKRKALDKKAAGEK